MVHYNRDIWPRRSHILSHLKEAVSGPRCRNILCNDTLENFFKEMKCMVSADIPISYPDWKLPFTVHTDSYDKLVGVVISQNNKPIAFFPRRLSKQQRNYTTT